MAKLGYATDKRRPLPPPVEQLDLIYNVPYKIAHIDPPWLYQTFSDKGKGRSADKHYQCQPNDFIYNMDLGSLMDKHSVIFLWVTEPTQEVAFEALKRWGYTFKTNAFSWVKLTKNAFQNQKKWELQGKTLQQYIERLFDFGQGHWTRANLERCIVATRGSKNPTRLKTTDARTVRSIIAEPVRAHSAKPLCVRDNIVRLLGDLPRIEIFASAADAQHGRDRGWDLIGDEITGRDVNCDIMEIVARRSEAQDAISTTARVRRSVLSTAPVPPEASEQVSGGSGDGGAVDIPGRKLKLGTLFAGWGGAEFGAEAAGLESTWAVEKDSDIAAVWEQNHTGKMFNMSISDFNPDDAESVDVIWASPPCQSSSIANSKRGETPLDREMAAHTIRVVKAKLPQFFFLENVRGYAKTDSFKGIVSSLTEMGYSVEHSFVNSADHGVPQTRIRLILRAILGADSVPELRSTHSKKDGTWNGWYAAVADLLPSCPPSQLAPWQLRRMPEELRTMLVENTSTIRQATIRDPNEPSFTVTVGQAPPSLSNMPTAMLVMGTSTLDTRQPEQPQKAVLATIHSKAAVPKALLVDTSNNGQADNESGRGVNLLVQAAPAPTVRAGSNHLMRGILVDGDNAGKEGPIYLGDELPSRAVSGNSSPRAVLIEGDAAGERCPTILNPEDPCFTVKTASGGRDERALLLPVNGENSDGRVGHEPCPTLSANHSDGKYRAVLIDGQQTNPTPGGGRALNLRSATDPAFVVSATTYKGMPISAESIRVVAMTPRCLARFQSIPDRAIIPEKRQLACRVIGNSVPSLLAQRVIESVLPLAKNSNNMLHLDNEIVTSSAETE